jgi:hypothetical protein
MANVTVDPVRGLCPAPFYQMSLFPDLGGHIDGRLCANLRGLTCCLPCPMTDWTYPDNFDTMTSVANWINVVGMACCTFLLASWICLPSEKTARHYLSICLTVAVSLMNLGFIIPLAGQPNECYDAITPHDMATSPICATSGSFLLAGGWAGVLWIFLRALSLHLQICWQLVMGRTYMWVSQVVGWGIPAIGLALLLVYSGVSFRFGATCHINHKNSLADFWIPLLAFAGLTVIIQCATFAYCIKVYLASLNDNSTTTEGSGLPSYASSIRTMTPRQAYRRVRRVIQLQWRGIVIVLIVVADVILFAVVFVFQDNTVQSVKENTSLAAPWIECLLLNRGNKNQCLDKTGTLVVSLPTVTAVLILLAMNGIWLLIFFGRWTMVTGWGEFLTSCLHRRTKKEFVSVDARMDMKSEPTRSYEMLSRDGKSDVMMTPISRTMSSPTSIRDGRRTPDYFGQTQEQFGKSARYNPHQRSFSSPRPPQYAAWEERAAMPQPSPETYEQYMNPLGMNKI